MSMIRYAKCMFRTRYVCGIKHSGEKRYLFSFALNAKRRLLSSKPHLILEKQNIWVKTKHSYSRTKAEIRYAWILLRSQYIQKTGKKFFDKGFLKINAGNSVFKFIGKIKTIIKHNLISDNSFESIMSLCMKITISISNSE